MELVPLLRFWREIRTGATAGAVVAVGFTAWRLAREGDLASATVALLASAAIFGGSLGLYLWRWVPKHWSQAKPMPAEAEVLASSKARWLALLAGLGFGLAAVGKGS